MRPRKPQTTGEGDLFRARLEQIINMGHELVQLASKMTVVCPVVQWSRLRRPRNVISIRILVLQSRGPSPR